VLTLDTTVMNNDEVLKRKGCDPTYKKVKGIQSLQLIWEGRIVEAIFRRGKRHSNYGNDLQKILQEVVSRPEGAVKPISSPSQKLKMQHGANAYAGARSPSTPT
jgi:hypothetical protein